MRRQFLILVALIVVTLTVAPAVAIGANETANETATEPEVDETGDVLRQDDIDHQLDSETRLTSWEYADGVFTLTIEADGPGYVTISEMVQQPEGAGIFSIEQTRLVSGDNQVSIAVEPVAGEAAVSLVTAQGVQEGRGIFVSTGQADVDRDPVAFGTTLFAVAFAAIGTGWFSFRKGREKMEESDEPEVDRIA